MNKFNINVSNELLILINKDIEKDQRQLRKCIKSLRDIMSLDEKVNMQRFCKYLEKKIITSRTLLFEIENINNK